MLKPPLLFRRRVFLISAVPARHTPRESTYVSGTDSVQIAAQPARVERGERRSQDTGPSEKQALSCRAPSGPPLS